MTFARPPVAEVPQELVAPPAMPLELAWAAHSELARLPLHLPAALAHYTSGSCPARSKHDRIVDTCIASLNFHQLNSGDLYP